MAIPPETKKQAFAMYCLEISAARIARELGIKSRATLNSWIYKGKWDKRRRELMRITKETTVKRTNDLHRGVTRAVLNIFSDSIKGDERKHMIRKFTPRDAMEAVKLERLIEGQSTENIEITPAEVQLEKIGEALEHARKRRRALARSSGTLGNT